MKGRPSRIMYFSDAPYFGGAEKYLELLISGLDKTTYTPCVITSMGAQLEGFRERLREQGIQTAEAVLGGPYDLRGYRDFFTLVRRFKPDLLHINLAGSYDAQASLVAPLAKAAGCRRVVTTEHLAMIPRLWKRHAAKRAASRFIDRVISITHSNVEYLTRTHGLVRSKIVVIHNGVDIQRLDSTEPAGLRSELGLEAGTFVFAVVGMLTERKGHVFLLDALAKLDSGRPAAAVLAVIGDGEEMDRLQSRSEELGIDDRVFFLGHRDNVAGLLKEIDCLVVPSLMEGMPFVILEAMVASKPVIASRIYGIPEAILEGETGILVEPRDARSLCAAMRSLVEDPAHGKSMGVLGRQRVCRHFALQKMVDSVSKVYELALSGRGATSSTLSDETEVS
jgi:glycosyltransferase involved in cell wall biosynthesis